MLPLAAQAVPCDPPSHSPRAAAFPSVHMPPGPYIQAVYVSDSRVTVPLLLSLHCPDPLLLGPYSRPPGVYLHVHLRAPPPPLLPSRRLLPVAPRSPLTQSGIRGASPENRFVPGTRSFRQPAIFPGPRSCTFAPRLHRQRGPSQIARPSAPAASDTLALPLLHRYTPRPLHRWEPAASTDRAHRCAYSAADGRRAQAPGRGLPERRWTRWSSPWGHRDSTHIHRGGAVRWPKSVGAHPLRTEFSGTSDPSNRNPRAYARWRAWPAAWLRRNGRGVARQWPASQEQR